MCQKTNKRHVGGQTNIKSHMEPQNENKRKIPFFRILLLVGLAYFHGCWAVEWTNRVKLVGEQYGDAKLASAAKKQGIPIHGHDSVRRSVVGQQYLGCMPGDCRVIGSVIPARGVSSARQSLPDPHLFVLERIAAKLISAMKREIQFTDNPDEWGGLMDLLKFVLINSRFERSMVSHDTAEVFISNAILERRSEDEVAFVLGHELGHIFFEHDVKKHEVELSFAAVDVVLLTFPSPLALVFHWCREAWKENVGLSREHWRREFDADRFGLMLSAKAGFNPSRAANYFSRSPNPLGETLTHPSDFQRNLHLESLIEEAEAVNSSSETCDFMCMQYHVNITNFGRD